MEVDGRSRRLDSALGDAVEELMAQDVRASYSKYAGEFTEFVSGQPEDAVRASIPPLL